METVDYTIRDVPLEMDSALRKMACDMSKSLDLVVVEVLKRGLENQPVPVSDRLDDLDFLIGSWKADPEVDRALSEFRVIDTNLWK